MLLALLPSLHVFADAWFAVCAVQALEEALDDLLELLVMEDTNAAA